MLHINYFTQNNLKKIKTKIKLFHVKQSKYIKTNFYKYYLNH